MDRSSSSPDQVAPLSVVYSSSLPLFMSLCFSKRGSRPSNAEHLDELRFPRRRGRFKLVQVRMAGCPFARFSYRPRDRPRHRRPLPPSNVAGQFSLLGSKESFLNRPLEVPVIWRRNGRVTPASATEGASRRSASVAASGAAWIGTWRRMVNYRDLYLAKVKLIR